MPALTIPSEDILDQAAQTLIHQGQPQRIIDKALWQLKEGLCIRPTAGGFLIPSGTRGGLIHRVDNVAGCSCEARCPCWHAAALLIIEQAQRRPCLTVAQKISAARAKAQIDELFA